MPEAIGGGARPLLTGSTRLRRLRELAERPMRHSATPTSGAASQRSSTCLAEMRASQSSGCRVWEASSGPTTPSDHSIDSRPRPTRLCCTPSEDLAYVQDDGDCPPDRLRKPGSRGARIGLRVAARTAPDDRHGPNRTLHLAAGAGSERKTTGSYYTPDGADLRAARLGPRSRPRTSGGRADDSEAAMLELKVVDPAAGSGHFLVAAAHRIGKRLAEVRTGEPEPPERAYRHAPCAMSSPAACSRVDINDLAVELCKVSLWLEALEPGKPLSFLDHHILVGNSLFGSHAGGYRRRDPRRGIQVASTGDDGRPWPRLKKRNKKERLARTLSLSQQRTPES